MISAEQRKEVESFLDPATGGPATVTVLGGGDRVGGVELPGRGHYAPPTVFSRVDPDSRLAQEEVFGPVLSIISSRSDEEALTIANNTIYGLSGAVWGADSDTALAFAGRVRAGQVDVNGAAFNPAAPFGGHKQSGIGREFGEYGIADVLETTAVQR